MIGIVMILLGCFLFLYLAASTKHKKAEDQKRAIKVQTREKIKSDAILRHNDNSQKTKILLKTKVADYEIIYQRTRLTN